MKDLQQYDPSTIDSIEFNIKNVKKYTSIVSIVLTLIIIVLSIAINIDSLYEIYKPRKELYITQYALKDVPQQFSDQPVCITHVAPNTVNGYLYISYQNQNGVYVNKNLESMTSLQNHTYLQTHIGNDNYLCYNLKGQKIKNMDRISFQGQTFAGTRLLLGTTSLNDILQYKQQPKITIFQIQPFYDIKINQQLNQFILKDRLFISYDPEKILRFSDTNIYSFNSPQFSGNCKITFLFEPPLASIECMMSIGTSYTIIRNNIAQILGGFLAWRGLILMPIAIILIVFPIVEELYKLELIKARYQSQIISNMNFNIITDLKRKLSRICPNSFPKQRVIDRAIEKIQDQLDLVSILQMQSIMRRQRLQFNQIQRQEDIFDCKIEQKDVKMDVLLQNPNSDLNPNITTQSLANVQGKIKVLQKNQQQQKSCILSKIKALIVSFDSTDIRISISTNQGKGYGSIASICSFILLTAGILFILVFLGIFSFKQTKYYENWQSIEQEQSTYIMPAYSFAFKINNSLPGHTILPVITLVDQKNQVIKQVSQVSSANDQTCANLVSSIITGNQVWYCTSEGVELKSQIDKQASIRIKTIYTPSLIQASKTLSMFDIIFKVQDQYGQSYLQRAYYSLGFVVGNHFIKKVNIQSDQRNYDIYQTERIDKKFGSQSVNYIRLSKQYKKISIVKDKIWDALNNMWGIVIIALQLILFRVGRMINLKILSSRINTDKQNKRSDILTILFDIDRLSKGIYREQLSSVGFYYKHKLTQQIS